MIPKIIHYCWLSNDPVPTDLQNYMKTWKEKLSEYEFLLWNFERFDIKQSLWVQQAFEAKKYAFASDFIRLFAVYRYGGMYMDMDIEVVKKFDNLLQTEQIIFAYEDIKKSGMEAGCFGAEKNNPFIHECLKYYDNRNFINEDGTFDNMPLPKIIKQIYDLTQQKFNVLSYDFFTAKSFETGKLYITENTYTTHHFNGSWLDDKEKKEQKIRRDLCNVFGKRLGEKIMLVFVGFKYIKSNGFCYAFSKTLNFFHKR